MPLTPPAGVETEPCEGRDLVSFSTVCPTSRVMLGGAEGSGSIRFPYEGMDVMLIQCAAVKWGPGLLCICLMIRFF